MVQPRREDAARRPPGFLRKVIRLLRPIRQAEAPGSIPVAGFVPEGNFERLLREQIGWHASSPQAGAHRAYPGVGRQDEGGDAQVGTASARGAGRPGGASGGASPAERSRAARAPGEVAREQNQREAHRI